MTDDIILSSQMIYMRVLQEDDVTDEYVSWLNDPNINKYLESRHQTHTVDSCKSFARNILEDNCNIVFAIFSNNNNKHIGNVKVGPVDFINKKAPIGLIIGEKYFWGKGLATTVISMMTNYAFKNLQLNKLYAGCYASNVGSKKAFLKAGYEVEGIQKEQFILDGEFEDAILLGIINPNECR